MKKNLFILSALGLSAATALTLSSCRDYDIMDEGKAKEVATAKEYANNFVARYGTPDPTHDWGMNEVLEPIQSISGSTSTRSGETDQGVNVQRNMWVLDFARTGQYNTEQAGVIGRDIKIPGWPNDDNRYYVSGGQGSLQNIRERSALLDGDQPVGDVTDYEIRYVSTWFRTHKNPGSIDLHLSDFFIQNVSVDKDQLEYRGYVEGYSNDLPSGVTVGNNGTNAEKASDICPSANSTQGNIQRKTSANETLNYSLDYLCFCSVKGNPDEVGAGWTHVNNFNKENSNYDPENMLTNGYREIKYVTSSGTEGFACRASMGTNQPWCSNWVLVHLTWNERMADGELHAREGYYLGFDFETETSDTKIEGDGFYSNWIIKITPGMFTPTSRARRVMCEDLGSTYDFDFNDVVYDIALETNNGKTDAIVSMQAAGGTLPIYVGINPSSDGSSFYEAHKLLGQNTSANPVNAVQGGLSHSVAIYRIENVSSDADLNSFPIYVDYGNEIKDVTGEYGNLDGNQYGQKGDNNDTPEYKVPRRFAVPVGVKWMQECKFIEEGYDKFKEWVQNKTMTFTVAGETGKAWYQAQKMDQLLYTGIVTATSGGGSSNPIQSWTSLDPWSHMNLVAGNHKGGLKIHGYEEEAQAIAYQLTTGGKNQLTLTVIYKAPEEKEVAGRLIPVNVDTDVNGDTESSWPYYPVNATDKHPLVYSEMTFNTATRQDALGADNSGKWTFVNHFTFTKEQLSTSGRLCDYILLYVKNQDNSSDIEVVEWYVHY